jgi:hypothetical protein
MLRELLQFVFRPLAAYCERHLVLYLDLGGDAPPPPDYKPVADASKEAAEIGAALGREQLAEGRWQYDQNMAVARPVIQAQLDIMRQTQDQGRDYYEYGKAFRPLEQQMMRQASGGLSPRDIVRLGVSGLNMPSSLPGRTQSAGVIANAAKAPGQQAPLMRFAQSTGSAGPRFQGAGVLPYLSTSDMDTMMQQQGGDNTYAGPTSPTTAPITLAPLGQRPPTPDPTPTITSTLSTFKTDMLKDIDERLKKQQEAQTAAQMWGGNDGG